MENPIGTIQYGRADLYGHISEQWEKDSYHDLTWVEYGTIRPFMKSLAILLGDIDNLVFVVDSVMNATQYGLIMTYEQYNEIVSELQSSDNEDDLYQAELLGYQSIPMTKYLNMG